MQQPQAGLEITADFHPLLFTLYLFPPKISIDGSQPMPAKWGVNLLPMTPGRHYVKFYWPAYWFLPSNVAEVVVDIPQGQVAQMHYRARWFFLLPGMMWQTGVRPMLAGAPAAIAQPAAAQPAAAQPAGWHPDPAGRHELRYWNGSTWTDDVSDAGVTTKDPVA